MGLLQVSVRHAPEIRQYHGESVWLALTVGTLHNSGASQYKLFHFSFIKVSMHSFSGVTSILSAKE
jgi:hypothetical protein